MGQGPSQVGDEVRVAVVKPIGVTFDAPAPAFDFNWSFVEPLPPGDFEVVPGSCSLSDELGNPVPTADCELTGVSATL